MSELLELRGIVKRFPGVVALDQVDFTLRSGEIHALMGENGAGKSTLIKAFTGVHLPNEGSMALMGEPIMPRSPLEAVRLGVSTVYQEVNLAPNLSVAENVCLGREPVGPLGIKWRDVRARAERALSRMGLQIDVRTPLGSCSVAIQQLVAIARALDVDAKVLVLDEPTSSLDRDETSALFDILRRLRGEGLGIVFVSHFLDQVYEIADRVTVLRNGKLVDSRPISELPKLELVSLMIGRDASSISHETRRAASVAVATPIVQTNQLGRRNAVSGVSVGVAPGETLGLAGLLGSGRTETLKLIAGADRADRGSIAIDGKTVRRFSLKGAIRVGIGLCPEDRKAEGILPELSVRENMLLAIQARRGWWRPIPRSEQQRIVDSFVSDLQIATSSAEKPIQFLSGGNQQKVLLARWLAAKPRLLLLDEPTRGIDVGARFEIESAIESLRKEGMAFAVASSELDEVVRMSTKLTILRDRRAVGSLDSATEEEAMRLMAGEGS